MDPPSAAFIPLGSPLDVADQLSFLDVSLEDDSLLPIEELPNPGHGPHTPSVVEASDTIMDTHAIPNAGSVQENDSSCQSVSEETVDINSPEVSQEPILSKKKKKNGFNLRKSLAWNNAFMTEEGVLDSEELSIVNKTFQKIPELPKASSHRQSTQVSSKLPKPALIPKAHLPSNRVASSVNSQQHLAVPITSARSSVNSLIGSVGTNHGVLKPPLTSRIQTSCLNQEKSVAAPKMEAFEVENQLKNKETDRRGIGSGEEVEPSRKSVTFACESISIKGGSHPKHVITNNKLFSGSGKAEVSKKLKLPFAVGHRVQASHTTMKMASSTDAVRRSSHVENPEIVSRDKPSGLRMPSPKLGFFDASRMTSQVVTNSSENTSNRNSTVNRLDVDGNMQNSRLKLPSASIRPRQITEAAVSSGKRGANISSSSITSGPLTRITEIPSMSATLLGSGRSSSNLPARKKPENLIQVLQAKNNVQNISPVAESPKPLLSFKDTPGQENSYQHVKSLSQLSDQDVV